jgi:hypothetical protein
MPPRHSTRALAVSMTDVFMLHRASFLTALAEFDQSRNVIHAVSSGLTSLFRGREPNQEMATDNHDNKDFLKDVEVVGRYIGPAGKTEHIYDHQAVVDRLLSESHDNDNMHRNPMLSVGKGDPGSNQPQSITSDDDVSVISVSVHGQSALESDDEDVPPSPNRAGGGDLVAGPFLTGLRPGMHWNFPSNRSAGGGTRSTGGRRRRLGTDRGYMSPSDDSSGGVNMERLERQLNNIANRLERIERVQNASRFRHQHGGT